MRSFFTGPFPLGLVLVLIGDLLKYNLMQNNGYIFKDRFVIDHELGMTSFVENLDEITN